MTYQKEHLPKNQHLLRQCFKNLNALKKLQTQEDMERHKGNFTTAEMYELKKLKAQNRLELSLRALQHEILSADPEEEEGEEE